VHRGRGGAPLRAIAETSRFVVDAIVGGTEGGRRERLQGMRDDDRFLFLQLFAAAADVFYLSYLGADARDGSTREPSVLVSELLDVAAAYHADADGARQALVVTHPLQPFAPAAFGADDGTDEEPRRFSYRAQWHPAAAAVQGVRVEPASWLQAPLPVPTPVDPPALGALSLGELSAFLRDPPAAFLRQRLALRLPRVDDAIDDCEPLATPSRGLQLQQLQQAVFDACMRGDVASLHARLRAQALLPSGPLGERALATLRTQLRPYVEAFTHWRGDDHEAGSRTFELDLDGVRLHGRIGGLYRNGLARFHFDPLHGPSQISHGLDWLVLCALGEDLALAQFVDATEPLPLRREPVTADAAQAALRTLLALRRQGLREPLPFGARAGWAWFAAVNDHGDNDDKGWIAASKQWRSDHGWSEGATASAQLALRGRDPFVDPALGQRFRAIARTLFDAVVHGRDTPDALDAAVIDTAALDAAVELSA
jgi:exodeoxyribonuclease V gamma subunit